MLITSSIPFPPISWWVMAARENKVGVDISEHYQKMSYRNRYYLAAPHGKILMSIPLKDGRNQRKAVNEILIDNKDNWQIKHWRTIVSLYARSPFFEYYEYRFRFLFEDTFEYLYQWNHKGLEVLNEVLNVNLHFSFTKMYSDSYPDKDLDIRRTFIPQAKQEISLKEYHQVFSDKVGFLENCSVLDLLFCEGTIAKEYIL